MLQGNSGFWIAFVQFIKGITVADWFVANEYRIVWKLQLKSACPVDK